MANIANLAVVLTANTAQFHSKLSGARAPLAQFGRSVSMVSARLKALAAGAVAAATAGGIAVLLKRQAEEIDSLGKMSDRIGINTEMLAGLYHAADLAGVEQETLNTALQKMAVNISKLSQKSRGQVDVLDELGLSARQLASMSVADQFFAIADALSSVQNIGDRARMTVEIFGKSGGALIPLFHSGGDAIREMIKDAERLGLTISRQDAAKVEAMNDAWARLKHSMEGLARQILPEIAPLVQAVADRFTEWSAQASKTREVTVSAIEKMAVGIGHLLDLWDLMKMGVSAYRVFWLNAAAAILETLDMLQLAMKKTLNWLPGVDFGEKKLFADITAGMRIVAKEYGEEFQKLLDQDSHVEKVKLWFNEIRAEADEAAEAAANAQNTMATAASDWADEIERGKSLLDAMKQGGLQFRAGTVAINSALASAQAELIRITGGGRGVQEIRGPQLERMIQLQTQIANNTRDPWVVARAG